MHASCRDQLVDPYLIILIVTGEEQTYLACANLNISFH